MTAFVVLQIAPALVATLLRFTIRIVSVRFPGAVSIDTAFRVVEPAKANVIEEAVKVIPEENSD